MTSQSPLLKAREALDLADVFLTIYSSDEGIEPEEASIYRDLAAPGQERSIVSLSMETVIDTVRTALSQLDQALAEEAGADTIAELTRYTWKAGVGGTAPFPHVDPVGEWVHFDDVRPLLSPSPAEVTVTDEMVERAATAFLNVFSNGEDYMRFEEVKKQGGEAYGLLISCTRAALQAALAPENPGKGTL